MAPLPRRGYGIVHRHLEMLPSVREFFNKDLGKPRLCDPNGLLISRAIVPLAVNFNAPTSKS